MRGELVCHPLQGTQHKQDKVMQSKTHSERMKTFLVYVHIGVIAVIVRGLPDSAVRHSLAHRCCQEIDVVDLGGCIALVAFQHTRGSVSILRAHLSW